MAITMAMICKHIVSGKLVKTTIKISLKFGTGPLCTQCFSSEILTLLAFITLCIIFFCLFSFAAAERNLELKLEERLLTAAREGDSSELKKLVSLQ